MKQELVFCICETDVFIYYTTYSRGNHKINEEHRGHRTLPYVVSTIEIRISHSKRDK